MRTWNKYVVSFLIHFQQMWKGSCHTYLWSQFKDYFISCTSILSKKNILAKVYTIGILNLVVCDPVYYSVQDLIKTHTTLCFETKRNIMKYPPPKYSTQSVININALTQINKTTKHCYFWRNQTMWSRRHWLTKSNQTKRIVHGATQNF